MIIELHGNNSTELNARILSWTLTDSSGDKADRCSITLDSDGLSSLPMGGDEFTIVINDQNRGKFQVSTITEHLKPEKLTVQLTPAKFNSKDETGWRESRKRTFKAATIGDVVTAVMSPHGYTVKIDPDLIDRPTEHLNQNEETDKQFITRLADKHDAIAKPFSDMFIFCKKGNLKEFSGKPKQSVVITSADLIKNTARIDYPSNVHYKGSKASWRNPESGQSGEIKIGGEPFYSLKEAYKTAEEAKQEATDKLQAMTRKGQTFSCSIEGRKGLFAESVLHLQGFDNPRITGAWSIDEVTLSGNRTTYTIQVSASRPKG